MNLVALFMTLCLLPLSTHAMVRQAVIANDVNRALSDGNKENAETLLLDMYRNENGISYKVYELLALSMKSDAITLEMKYWLLKHFVAKSPMEQVRDSTGNVVKYDYGKYVLPATYVQRADFFVMNMPQETREAMWRYVQEHYRGPFHSGWQYLRFMIPSERQRIQRQIEDPNYLTEQGIIGSIVKYRFTGRMWYQIPELRPLVASYVIHEVNAYSIYDPMYERILLNDLSILKSIDENAFTDFAEKVESAPDPFYRVKALKKKSGLRSLTDIPSKVAPDIVESTRFMRQLRETARQGRRQEPLIKRFR